MSKPKNKGIKCIKNNLTKSLREVNIFLCNLSNVNKGRKLFNILKKK